MGFWTDGVVRIGHTRLAIQGLDERAEQPLESSRHVLAYNGELYGVDQPNDTAYLLSCLDADADLKALKGFWAFVAYDKQARRLTLCRDQFGVKPLYYWLGDGGRMAVGSTIQSLLDVIGPRPELDYAAISEYVRYQLVFGEKTFFKGIRCVLPGSVVVFDVTSGEIESVEYEDIWRGGDVECVSDEWLKEARELLRRCVIESTTSDVSFTAMCSGGLDSSVVTRLASPVLAYHANYSDPECNETVFARAAVEGTHTRLMVTNADEGFDLVARLESIVEDFDDLAVGSVILPLDELLSHVKRRHKVVLTGAGGDELFGGYVRYQLAAGACRQPSYRGMFERMARVGSIRDRFEIAHQKGATGIYRFFDEKAAVDGFREVYGDGVGVGSAINFDRRHFLAGLLTIDDRIGGRHGLEARPSLLHQDFVRHVARLSPEVLIHGEELKGVWRQIVGGMDGILPASILHRGDKMGFTTPIGSFVNRSSHRIRERLVSSRFRHLYDLRGFSFAAETKFSREVFGLLMLDLWLNRYA